MSTEIERKFLVLEDGWRENAVSRTLYRQTYIQAEKHMTIRVRLAGERAFLTIKTPLKGISRNEYEYELPFDDASEMLGVIHGKPSVEKYRYVVPYKGHDWEVDEFLGENEGLIVAEIELSSEDENFERPPWVGGEVTMISAYCNSMLAKNPYKKWKNGEPPLP